MKFEQSGRLLVHVEVERWPLKKPFRFAGRTMCNLDTIVVTLERHGIKGRGEAAGVFFRSEDAHSMARQIVDARSSLEAGFDHQSLREILQAGGARNAVDCALWELEAKSSGMRVWELANIAAPKPLLTTFTCGADDPTEMAIAARSHPFAKAIKLKLTGEPIDADRVAAVRSACPDVWLGVDGNQGFQLTSFERLVPTLIENKVSLIEQPFAIGQEHLLDNLDCPIAIAADESVLTSTDVSAVAGRFDVVNIKLDKSGGLTEALLMVQMAQRHNLDIMVGNMMGTSLAMAPAMLIGNYCNIVDLDGPIHLESDRVPAMEFRDGHALYPAGVWG